MDWILAHTRLPGLDTLQTIGAGASLYIGVIVGKAIVKIVGEAVQFAIAKAKQK